MKKIILFAAVLNFVSAKAQTINGDFLDINNIKARINADGSLFSDYGTTFTQGFEVPQGSGNHCAFAGGLWIGGVDAGNVVKLAGQTYKQTGVDFFPGPLTSLATTDLATMNAFNRVWKINKCDIDAYYNWIAGGTAGSNPLDSAANEAIYSWPSVNQDGAPLAPYWDVNGNGTYEPWLGEVPDIKGDQAIFFVCNDKGDVHTETGAAAIGIEIQGMAYAYSCTDDDALYNTIFTSYKIINKSSFTLDSTFVGNWTDVAIGNEGDDFIGSDVTRGDYYWYNGDSLDTNYGSNPPAQALVFLTGPYADPNGVDDPYLSTASGINYGDGVVDNERLGMSHFLHYANDASVTGNPIGFNNYYRYLSGVWQDGTSWTYGGNMHLSGGPACNYMYPGTSDPLGYGTSGIPQSPWDEITEGNAPGDRRGLGSFGPFKMLPGSVNTLEFAYVNGRATSGGNLASVAVMNDHIDSIKYKLNTSLNLSCGCDGLTGIHTVENEFSFSVYPNPATDNISINYTSPSKNYSITIFDLTGRVVKKLQIQNSISNTISISDLKSGMYLITVSDGNSSGTKRFIKE